jgi:hypothetical protein
MGQEFREGQLIRLRRAQGGREVVGNERGIAVQVVQHRLIQHRVDSGGHGRLSLGDGVFGAGVGEGELAQEFPAGERVATRDEFLDRLGPDAFGDLAVSEDADALTTTARQDEADPQHAPAVVPLTLPLSGRRREGDGLGDPVEGLARAKLLLRPLPAAGHGAQAQHCHDACRCEPRHDSLPGVGHAIPHGKILLSGGFGTMVDPAAAPRGTFDVPAAARFQHPNGAQ